MHFYFCCVVLALAVSSSTAMPAQCTIPAVKHGQVLSYSSGRYKNNRFRECFLQLLTGEKIPDSDSVTLRCEKGYLPAGSSHISKVHRLKEDVVTCEDGTWSKPLHCEAEITCGEPPPIEYAATISLFTEDYPLGSIVSYECQSGYVIKGRTTASQCVMSDDGSQAVWTKAPMSCIAQSCGDPGFVNNSRRIGSDFTFPHTAEYECEEGYKLNGTGVRHCEPSGMWSGNLPTCEPQSCGDPGVVINANRIGSDFTFPHTAKFECEEGYKLNGTDVRQCQADGVWSGKLPICERVHCERPRNPENGNVSFISLEYGTELRYECNKGFNLSNHEQRRCTGNGTWSKEEPVCKAQTCGDPGFVVNSSRIGSEFTFPHTVKFECDEGYKLNGTDVRQCQEYGVWSGKLPTCELQSCGDPGFVVNASRNGSDFTFPHSVKFECKEGYKLNGTGVRQCQADGVWSGKLPTCERIYCDRPRNPKNGNVSFISLEYGTELRYECNKGFNLNHHQQRHCTGNGTWSNEEPVCSEVTCEEPQAPTNGFRQLTDGLKVDSSVIYSCADGKILVGASTSKCLIDGHWTFTPPECVDISCGEPPPIEFATVTTLSTKEYPLGTIVAYECQLGYFITGRTTTSQCVMSDDGSQAIWTKAPMSCSALSCGDPGFVVNASRTGSDFTFPHTVKFECKEGYKLKGTDVLHCEASGRWSAKLPTCEIYCPDPGVPINGFKNSSEYDVGRGVGFRCRPGYVLLGSEERQCLPNRTWSGVETRCLSPYDYNNGDNDNDADMRDLLKVILSMKQEKEENFRTNILYFIFDISGRLGGEDFRKSIELAKAIVKRVGIRQNRALCGAFMGMDNAVIEFLPLEFTSTDEVINAFERIEYTGGGASYRSALMLVRTELIPLIHAVLGRQGQKSIIFILTNRRATMDENREYEAKTLKEAGVEIYCVGITEKVHKETLYKIASHSKDEPHVFIFPNYLRLSKLIQVITNGRIDYSQCGVAVKHVGSDTHPGRIIGETTVGEPWPWMAAIYISPHDTVDTADTKVECGGSIIHERFVLTAGFCMYTKDLVIRNLKEVIIKVGLRNVKDESFVQEHVVQNLFIHPKYSVRGSFDYDIVLLQLRRPIEFNAHVRPICLPPSGLPEDTTFYKANEFGLTTRWSDEGVVSQHMNVQRKSTEKIEQLVLPIQSRGRCTQSLVDLKVNLTSFTDRMFCAGDGRDGNDICRGERGRPMMQSQLNTEGYLYWTQIGIFSWGVGCGLNNTYGYYSHVQQLRLWIDKTIEDAIKESA